jgi:predicted amidohydrolase YtcJ
LTLLLRPGAAAFVLIAALASDVISQGPAPPADLVLVEARVVTVDEGFGTAAALAVRGGRFVAVGSNDQVRRHIGPATRVIEGRGRTVLPGFIDTHVHALDVANGEATQPFVNLRSIGQLQAWLRTEAPRRPRGAWIWTPRTYPTRLPHPIIRWSWTARTPSR